jgi:dihydropyrimidine dehydrogenase (NAD+) subunit PreA
VAGKGSHGGYCGPAVKPIALNMVSSVANDREVGIPISGIGGIQAWQDGVEFILVGAASVQVCTAVMHYGFRIVEHMISGMKNWMREKGFARISDFQGKAAPNITDWGDLDLSYKVVAEIDQAKCIHCGLCYIACEDGCHQSINWERVPVDEFTKKYAVASQASSPKLQASGNGNGQLINPDMHAKHSGDFEILPGEGDGYIGVFTIKQHTCVGCNMCSLVCPAPGCISMKEVDSGLPHMTWREYQAKLGRGECAKIQPPEHV